MILHIFEGSDRVFAATPDEEGGNLPEAYAPWKRYKVMDIHPNEPQPGVDVNECLADIREHGIHLTQAHVRITQLVINATD